MVFSSLVIYVLHHTVLPQLSRNAWRNNTYLLWLLCLFINPKFLNLCSTIVIWCVHIRFSSTKTAINFIDEDLFISYSLIVRIGSWSSRLSFFKKLRFTPCKAEQPLWVMELQEKKHIKVKEYRKSVPKKMSVNSRLKVTKIIGQRKVFSRQRIPESTCARKETVKI